MTKPGGLFLSKKFPGDWRMMIVNTSKERTAVEKYCRCSVLKLRINHSHAHTHSSVFEVPSRFELEYELLRSSA